MECEESYSGDGLPPLGGVNAEVVALAARLKDIGVDVAHGAPYADIKKAEFDAAVAAFLKTIEAGDTIIFFYSGHGAQDSGRNYLIPLDGDPATLLGTSVSLDDDILKPLAETGADIVLVCIA